jgi:hypothetical protein
MNAASLPTLWANCVERLKDRVNNRSFWEAIEQTHPITIENDTLIIGLEAVNFNHASHIQQTSTLHTIMQTVKEVFNQPLQVRLIEGANLADWEAVKERDARIAAMKQQTVTRKVTEDVNSESWDALYDHIARLYAQTPHRSLPQGKARYANEALYLLVEAMDTLYPDEADEVTERSLARILERIANASEIPSPMLAFELERLRAWRRSEAA